MIDRLKSVLPVDSGPESRTFECDNCGNEFTSMKSPERAKCMECLSGDTSLVD